MLLLFAATFALSVTSLEIHQSVSEVEKGDEMHYFISERQQLPHIRLIRDLLSTKRYDPSVRPVGNYSKSLTVHISMSLYQVVDVDEPSQYLTLNIWMIQKWVDEFLDWNPSEYDMINYTVLPHSALWIPDTFIYNSVVMSREGSERYMNVAVKSRHWKDKCGAEVFFLYPALYTIRCRIDIRYFPYDHQNCTLTLGSWTSSKALLNYTTDKAVNMHSYIPNEEWDILSFNLYRHEYLYACCQDPWVIIEGSLIIRRKPLYYVVNLIIPTTILTLVAIVGFFTPASTNDERTEKITIGITALLAISILMLMVSDQMPTTSDFVPLIAWFYLSNIIVISTATFCTCTVLCIHGHHKNGKLPPVLIRILFFKYICNYLCISPPYELIMLWNGKEGNVLQRLKQKKKSIQYTVQSLDKEKLTLTELSVKSPMQGILESETNKEAQQGAQRLSAKENWTQISFRLKDILHKNRDRSEVIPKENSLTSLLQKMRKTSTVHSDRRNLSLWNSAVQFVRFTSNDLSQKPESAELKSMKYHRQCTLEWEFLATVVDRIFLLLFSTITILIIIVLAITAKLAQYRFNTALEIAQN
ncbi:Neurotransmitter-gated ion-channel ligand binding domain family protein [Brugia pahangi]